MKLIMQKRILNRLCAALVLCFVVGSASAAELVVSAAVSLTSAFREIGAAFENRYPGSKVLFNFGASDALAQQIAKGAPVAVFASADQEAMNKAAAQKLIEVGSRKNFVGNTLVLIVPAGSPVSIASLADLLQPAIKRISLGNPVGVPAGRYAKHALESAGLWAALESKAISAQSVRQSLDYVARNEVDAGFVYATDAAIQKDRVRVAMTVPCAVPITYPIAAIAGSGNVASAQQFIDFVLTPDGQAILAKYGFIKP